MQDAATEQLIPILLECPACGGAKRGTSLRRFALVDLLEQDADIVVVAGACWHERSLTVLEKNNLRKALAEGTI
jgi:hypothetical protein